MIANDRCKISDYTRISKFEEVLRAMGETNERIEDAEERLESILQRLETEDVEEGLSGDIEDLLYSVALVFYAKGVIAGKRIEQLCV